MATAINAATAFVTIRLERTLFRRELRGANEQLSDLATTTARVGGAFLTMGLIAGAALARITKSASDAVEAANRFNQVFRSAGSGAATSWAKSFAGAVGRAKVEVMDTLSTFQGFFIGLGFGADQAEVFSRNLTKAAVDFASFNNIADNDAVRRFIGALSGSPETLDKFGFNVREAAVNQELLAMGIKKTTRTATEQQKAMAKMNIILRTMGKLGAAGDAVRTADEFANVMKRLSASFRNFTEEAGSSVIPTMKQLMQGMISVINEASRLNAAFPGMTQGVVAATGAFTALGLALIAAAAAMQVFNLTGVSALAKFVAKSAKVSAALASISSGFTALSSAVGSLGALGAGAIFTVIAAEVSTLISIVNEAASAWVQLNAAIAESEKAGEALSAMNADRSQKATSEVYGDEGASKLVDRSPERLERLKTDLERQADDISRNINKMETEGRERGNFLYEFGRAALRNNVGAAGTGGDLDVDRREGDGGKNRLSYSKRELDAEKARLKEVRSQLAQLEKRQSEKKAVNKTGAMPSTGDFLKMMGMDGISKLSADKQVEAMRSSLDSLYDKKTGVKFGEPGITPDKEIYSSVGAGASNVQDALDTKRNKQFLEISRSLKKADAFSKAVDKFKEAGKIMAEGMKEQLKKQSDFDQNIWNKASQAYSDSVNRLIDLDDEIDNSRGSFGSLSGANIMRTGGIFGMQNMKEQKELKNTINAANAVMRIFEKKYGKDWKDKVQRDKHTSEMFERLMAQMGAI